MQPNGNVIVDTICRTAELGVTITGAGMPEELQGDATIDGVDKRGRLSIPTYPLHPGLLCLWNNPQRD